MFTCLSCFTSLELEKLLDTLDCSRVLFFDDVGAPILIAAKSPIASSKPALPKPEGAAVCFNLKFKFGFYLKLGFSSSAVLLVDACAPFFAFGHANLSSSISFFILNICSISFSKSDTPPSDSAFVFLGLSSYCTAAAILADFDILFRPSSLSSSWASAIRRTA